jgi:hypothetical protein
MKHHDALEIIRAVAQEPAFVEIERDEVAGELVFALTDMRWEIAPLFELVFDAGVLYLISRNNGEVGQLLWADADEFELVDFHLLFKVFINLYRVVSPTHGAAGLYHNYLRFVSEAECMAMDVAAILATQTRVHARNLPADWGQVTAEQILQEAQATCATFRSVQDACR